MPTRAHSSVSSPVRTRRALPWIALALTLLVAGVWLSSGIIFTRYVHHTANKSEFGGIVMTGQLLCWMKPFAREGMVGLSAIRNGAYVLSWNFEFVYQPPSVIGARIPLWLPTLLLTIPTTLLFLKRRRAPGLCPHCSYPLSSLPPNSPCPECGTQTSNLKAKNSSDRTPI